MGKGEKSIHGEVDCRVAKCHESPGYICVKKLPKAEKAESIIGGFQRFLDVNDLTFCIGNSCYGEGLYLALSSP